jgi:hypothetical protein
MLRAIQPALQGKQVRTARALPSRCAQNGSHIALDFVLNPNAPTANVNGRREGLDRILDQFVEKRPADCQPVKNIAK